jgi:molecular chaperone GrpE
MEKEGPETQNQDGEQEQPDSNEETVSQEELAALFEEADREREQFKRLLQRTQADFANYRKRSEEERQEHQQQATARVLQKLLPILDDFEMAIDHAEQSSIDQSWIEGMQLISRKLSATLESEGVTDIEAMGQEFDPFEHEAIAYQTSEDKPEGTIIEVTQKGYKLRGRILRPARVVVAKGVTSSEESEEKEDA